nr:MAG: ORF1 [Torque teno midi virus]
MPFWWRRRRKPWWGRFRYRKRFYKNRRRRRRRLPRRRTRRTTRRRHRRKRKVRRKLQKISIKQWQPDRIVKCKIKGYSCLVMGAEGRQMYCYTNEASDYPQPKAPGGGGFGCETITLKWLFQEYLRHNNIWTKSNDYTDLCRYTGCKITIYRHPSVDFVIFYDRQPPFDINKFTYPELQPQNVMLRRKKRVILSRLTNPNGKLKHIIKIKPPKQLITKWFFQRDFCSYGLLKLCASAADFNYPRISPLAQSTILTVLSLNMNFYQNSDWAQTKTDQPYRNITTQKLPLYFTYTDKQGRDQVFSYNPESAQGTDNTKKYYYSINRETGLFSPQVLLAKKVSINNTATDPGLGSLPLITLRYNPQEDTGHGNEVYLTSIITGHYNKPSISTDYSFNGVPLYVAFYGFWNYLQIYSHNKGFYKSYMFVVKSDALKPLSVATPEKYFPILDSDFVYGKLPWDEYMSADIKKLWYPTAERQQVIINQIVESGPFMPKLSNIKNSTWELNYKYEFFFKWGGPYTTDQPVEDPCTRNKYNVPDTLQQSIQITDPEKNKTEGILHDWDFRRGFITQTALKRMSQNLPIDSSLESDDSESPKKKRKITKELPFQQKKEEKIQKCLLSLCEEPTCQETPETLQQFILQQRQQQRELKHSLLQLLTHLKKGQTCMELQTGLLE